MVSWNINPAIVPDETSIHFHAAIMVERAGNGVVPEVNISGGGFHALMGFFNSGHDHHFEVLRRQDYHLVVVILSLIMVCLSREKVCFLVGGASFMVKGEVVFC